MPDLISERRGEVLIVTFNRPEKRNALSNEMLQIFEQTLDQAAEDETLRALILTGAGNKSFSSGIDLGLLFEHLSSNPSGEKIRRKQRQLQQLICQLEELEIVNELAAPGRALERAVALAGELTASGPLAIAWAKRVIDRGQSLSLEDSLVLEQHAMTEILPSDDLKEGVAAFLEKRSPKFKGNRRS